MLSGAGWGGKAGAAWNLNTYSNSLIYKSGDSQLCFSTNVTVVYKNIAGWITPLPVTIGTITNFPLGTALTYSNSYIVSKPTLLFNPANGFGFSGTTGTVYRIESRTNLPAAVGPR